MADDDNTATLETVQAAALEQMRKASPEKLVEAISALVKERNQAVASSDAKRIVLIASLRKLIADWRADRYEHHGAGHYADQLEELIELLTRA